MQMALVVILRMGGSMNRTLRKRPTHLSLTPARLAFGRRYAAGHGTSLSELTDNLLSALEQVAEAPLEEAAPDPLDGILLGTAMVDLDKRALRHARHEGRLAR
jgi:hypothetical protein